MLKIFIDSMNLFSKFNGDYLEVSWWTVNN